MAERHNRHLSVTSDFAVSPVIHTVRDQFKMDSMKVNGSSGTPLELEGDARVFKSLWVPFNGIRAPGTKPATFVEHGISGAWEFSDGTDDTIVANLQVPPDMDLDNLAQPRLLIGWSSTSAVGDAAWQVEYLWTGLNNDTTAAADDTLTETTTVSGTAEGLVVTTFQLADMVTSDICIHLRIKRMGDAVGDTLADTAELHGICLTYLSNILGLES